jgi:hypothetical protein
MTRQATVVDTRQREAFAARAEQAPSSPVKGLADLRAK